MIRDLRIKGWIATILEGGKVLKESLMEEMRSVPEVSSLIPSEIEAHLQEMLEYDETVRKIIAEENGTIREYWELNE